MKVIDAIQNFINVESKNYDGFRPRSLASWSNSMCYPICFDSEVAKQEFEHGIDEDELPEDLIPIGLFYEENSTNQINGIWAFILVKNVQDDEEIILWSDEGPESLNLKLGEFLETLRSTDSPEWKMV